MPSCLKGLNIFLKKCDLFSTTQFLRFRGDPEYSTMAGGVTSLLIIAIFIALFSSMGLQTARKQIIDSTLEMEYDINPQSVNIRVHPDNLFMNAIGIQGLNLNLPNLTYFDVELTQTYMRNGETLINQTVIPLQQCTAQHWAFEHYFGDTYNTFRAWEWKCMPLGQEVTVGGKFTSEIWSFLTYKIKKCNTATTSNCISDADLTTLESTMGDFRVAVGFVNVVINPSEQTYIQPILEDRNFYSFTTTRAISGNGYIVESEIQTDESLMPYEDVNTQTFTSVPNFFQTYTSTVTQDTYVNINLTKDPLKMKYTRTFNKVDNYFSYVGGLIGTILGFIFILNAYSEVAYCISLASQLYLKRDGEKISSRGFHLGYMVTTTFYKVIEFLGCCTPPDWKTTEDYTKCMDEVESQLDIGLIMQKLIFFERAVFALLDQHQVEALHLHNRYTLQEAEDRRIKYEISQSLKRKTPPEQDADAALGKKNSESHLEMANRCARTGMIFPQELISEPTHSDKKDQEISVESVESAGEEVKERLRANMIRLYTEAKRGNQVSKRILKNVSPEVCECLHLKKAAQQIEKVDESKQTPNSKDQQDDNSKSVKSMNLEVVLDIEEQQF